MCTRGREDQGGRTGLNLPGPLLETELQARQVDEGRSLSGSFGKKEEQHVGKMFTGCGRAEGSKEMIGTVVGWIIPPPKDVHILNPETCGHITLHGKRDFAEMLKLRIFRKSKMILDYPGGLITITRVLRRGRQRVKGGGERCNNRRKRLGDARKVPGAKGCRRLRN